MKIKETISSWLTHRYEILVRDEENFEEKRNFSYNHAKALAIVVPILVLMLVLGFWIGSKNSSLPITQKTEEIKLKKDVLMLQSTVDSLIEVTNQYNRFYENFRKAVKADVKELREDTSHITKNQVIQTDTIKDYIAPADMNLRKEYEGMNISLTSDKSSSNTDNSFKDFSFFPPIKGIITERFDAKNKHLGIDLVAQANEAIKAVADGTVVFSSWTEDTGNVIGIQHQGSIVTFYKHNAVLLKKQGDFVKAGDVIAIIGNTGRLSSGPHLHFEIWYKGNAVNPEKFVSF
jgi:murein DD-endopeptidase MepM/ murein hydrolase activator NlpD